MVDIEDGKLASGQERCELEMPRITWLRLIQGQTRNEGIVFS
jgi:hypothetical protein